jgi:ferredoxin
MTSRKVDFRKGSTRRFFQEGRNTEDYSLFDFLHGYVYGRWPYFYIGVGTGEHPLNRWIRPVFNLLSRLFDRSDAEQAVDGSVTFADTYHGKVVTTDSAADLVQIGEEVQFKDLEPIVPYARARDIIMKNPDRIVVLDCPCRTVRADPCTPLDVCLIVGEPFASFVLDHQPDRARAVDAGEAVEILKAEHERGHVHHAFFKDAMLQRFYAICNCCSCCCGAMEAQRNGTNMLTSSGYLCRVEETHCRGCGECEAMCPFGAVILVEGVPVIAEQACMGCGICVSRCVDNALWLERAPHKGQPLEIKELMEEAARKETFDS